MAREPITSSLSQLVVDATGVGRPVVELLERAGLSPISITITGGDVVTSEGYGYRVPKRDLISAAQVLLQTERLAIAKGLPQVQVLVEELLAFRVKINTRTAHDTYEAWREGVYDTRYVVTLQKHLALAKQEGVASQLVAEVQAWLATFSVNDDLQESRRRMAEVTAQLHSALRRP